MGDVHPITDVPRGKSRAQAQSTDLELEALLSRCALREERALAELYNLVSAPLLGIMLRILRSRALAEEALQDVMVRVWQHADRYVAYKGRAMPWLISIARYRAIDVLRAQRTQVTLDDAPAEALMDVAAEEFPDTTTSLRLRRALDDCLKRLTPDQRKCLSLAYIEGYSQDEIATAINSPLGTVKSWVRRGLSSLKRCMDS
jgi:RNA polymerase sigma-70 factor (ECF subfamily)